MLKIYGVDTVRALPAEWAVQIVLLNIATLGAATTEAQVPAGYEN